MIYRLTYRGSIIEEDELIGFDIGNYESGGDGWAKPSPYKIDADDRTKLDLGNEPKPLSRDVLIEIY